MILIFLSKKNISFPMIRIVLVMKRYPQTLWNYLESNNYGLKERFKMAIKLTKELKIAHDGSVVHRDLKPTNIMVDEKKELTLVDFGIGNPIGALDGSCGTPGFNAPEQLSGEDQDDSVDIFSLGKNLILILFSGRLAGTYSGLQKNGSCHKTWKINWPILVNCSN